MPHNRNSWLLAKGFKYVSDRQPESLITYVHMVVQMQWQFSNSYTNYMDDTEVLQELSRIVYLSGLDGAEFMKHVDDYEADLRSSWKFGARRKVADTPWYSVNGIAVPLA